MAPYGSITSKAFGVSIGERQRIAKTLGGRHDLAAAPHSRTPPVPSPVIPAELRIYR